MTITNISIGSLLQQLVVRLKVRLSMQRILVIAKLKRSSVGVTSEKRNCGQICVKCYTLTEFTPSFPWRVLDSLLCVVCVDPSCEENVGSRSLANSNASVDVCFTLFSDFSLICSVTDFCDDEHSGWKYLHFFPYVHRFPVTDAKMIDCGLGTRASQVRSVNTLPYGHCGLLCSSDAGRFRRKLSMLGPFLPRGSSGGINLVYTTRVLEPL